MSATGQKEFRTAQRVETVMMDTDQRVGAKQEDTTAERLVYIEASPKSSWRSIAKVVQDADEMKIRDTKEDIDTLLVFAGLFSAVLSAFLVETYQALQPDSQEQIIALLQVIATQNYTLGGGLLNATYFPQTVLPLFEAPTWALRVNGLWFASLIISLAAGSIGMLVKSWLREYLAVDHVTPQLRLRTRQYRYPGLQTWKVFEIAAALPLLLQLALSLFFVGLCFFTTEINPRMKPASLPLVAAWAFFFVLTTIAPVVSPRCPFKLVLLQGLLKRTRRWLRPSLLSLGRACAKCSYVLVGNGKRIAMVAFTVTMRTLVDLAAFLSCATAKIEDEDPCSHPNSDLDLSSDLNLGSNYNSELNSDLDTDSYLIEDEEDIVINGNQDDIGILTSIDAVMLDDGLLETMGEVLLQSRPRPNKVIKFIVDVVRNRSHSRNEEMDQWENLDAPLDLTNLSRRVYELIVKAAVQALAHSDSKTAVKTHAALILMSSSSYSLPDDAREALARFIEDAGDYFASRLGSAICQHPDMVLPAVSCSIASLIDSASHFRISSVLDTFNNILRSDWELNCRPGLTLIHTVQNNPQLSTEPRGRPILLTLWSILIHITTIDSFNRNDASLDHNDAHSTLYQCFHLLWTLAGGLNKADEVAEVLLGDRCNRRWYILGFAALSPQRRIDEHSLSMILQSIAKNDDEYRKMLFASKIFCDQYVECQRTKSEVEDADYVGIDLVRLCATHIKCYSSWLEPRPHTSKGVFITTLVEYARAPLWSSMSTALRRYWDNQGWTQTEDAPYPWNNTDISAPSAEDNFAIDRQLAVECLHCMQAMDDIAAQLCESSNVSSAASKRTPHSKFPKDLYTALELFSPPGPVLDGVETSSTPGI